MFNFLVRYGENCWDLTPYDFDKTRFGEYTNQALRDKYKAFDENAIKELKSFVCLFMSEDESSPSRIGYLDTIKIKSNTGKIGLRYYFDPIFPEIPSGEIQKLKTVLDIPDFEMNRTHWAVKDEDLLQVFLDQGLINKEQINSSKALRDGLGTTPPIKKEVFDKKKIFVVHGRDNEAKQEVGRFIEKLGLEAIILHEQPNRGMTIIEKIESYSDVGFSVVLYTSCDIGGLASDEDNLKPRARQNVVFEHGYLIGKLGRDKVSALVKGQVEAPNDISGIVYTEMDDKGAWKAALVKEMRAAGYDVSMNRAL